MRVSRNDAAASDKASLVDITIITLSLKHRALRVTDHALFTTSEIHFQYGKRSQFTYVSPVTLMLVYWSMLMLVLYRNRRPEDGGRPQLKPEVVSSKAKELPAYSGSRCFQYLSPPFFCRYRTEITSI